MKSTRLMPVSVIFLACLTLLSSVLWSSTPANAGLDAWTTSGPADRIGTVTVAMAVGNDQIVYASGQQGLWKSLDGGSSWSLVGNVKLSLYASITTDPRNPAVVYSGGADSLRGIIKSTDGGANWALLYPNVEVQALAVDPTRPNIIFAGVASSSSTVQILKSVDAGVTWNAVSQSINASPGVALVAGLAVDVAHPDSVYAALQLYHGGSVMRSVDGGAHWTQLQDASPAPLMVPSALEVSPTAGATSVYVGWGLMGSKALAVSHDAGNTWKNLTSGLPAGGSSITSLIAPKIDGTVIASIPGANPQTQEQGGVYLSRDAGQSWMQLAPLAQSVDRMAWAPITRTLYAGSANGVWLYTVPDAGFRQTVDARFESYYDSHDGLRVLGSPISFSTEVRGNFAQYFEKGRIEDHTGESADPNWQLMYGLLVDELQQSGSNLPVGGDVSTINYAAIKGQAAENLRVSPPPGFAGGANPLPGGSVFVPFTADLSPAPGHNVPGTLWDFINRADLFPGGWLHDIGLPITEPMGAIVDKGSAKGRQITIQAFQRTILTYDPLNPPDWQVERANVGTDYRKAFPRSVPN